VLGFVANSRYGYTTRVTRAGQPLGQIRGMASARAETAGSGSNRLRRTENGEWTAGPHVGLAVTNAWLAKRPGGQSEGQGKSHSGPTIDIHQDRGRATGGGSSAYLLTLLGGPTRWHTEHPHPCAEDSYSLTVHTEPGGLVVLDWAVVGPAKNDRLVTTYNPDR